MSISGVNGIGATAYAYMNSSMKTTGEGNFASEVQKAEERQSTTSTTSRKSGDRQSDVDDPGFCRKGTGLLDLSH